MQLENGFGVALRPCSCLLGQLDHQIWACICLKPMRDQLGFWVMYIFFKMCIYSLPIV
ncbi:hypothetical protein HanXRQr2_Chr14g0626851 [Helianthus annuus]|uniref:Uncharacterized protein n=1 Tax=Helianthus annuus TaxID=4232 RepID=A0A9K3E610_HELAN|nr:hypothetical protein HanXRQr2_Chr14g0626851 [Helianthus annuus]KAJ0839004.1 hypothetical protein HanPSC8_Chr14g0601631 [Helianthus annuus]